MIAGKRSFFHRWVIAGAAMLVAGCASQDSTRNTGGPISDVQDSSGQPAMEDGVEPEILPQTHMAAGRLHESQNNMARAAEQYRLAVAAQPNYAEAYNRLGIVLDRMMRFAEADKAFQRAIALAPNQAHLHNNLGFSYTMQSRWAEAEASFQRALELNPEFARARVNLGMVLAQQNRYDQAKEQFLKGLVKADAYYNLGLMYQSKDMLREAAQAYKTALEFKPEMTSARERLAKIPEGIVSSVQGGEIHNASPDPAARPGPSKIVQSQRPASPVSESQIVVAPPKIVQEPEASPAVTPPNPAEISSQEPEVSPVVTPAKPAEESIQEEPAEPQAKATQAVSADVETQATSEIVEVIHLDEPSQARPMEAAAAAPPEQPVAELIDQHDSDSNTLELVAQPVTSEAVAKSPASQPANAAPAATRPAEAALPVASPGQSEASNWTGGMQNWINNPEGVRQLLSTLKSPLDRAFGPPSDLSVSQDQMSSPNEPLVLQPMESSESTSAPRSTAP